MENTLPRLQQLGDSQIADLHVKRLLRAVRSGQEDIRTLQIPVQNLVLVQVIEPQDDLVGRKTFSLV